MGLYSKLGLVMDGVSRIKKNGYNAFHKYSYVTESDVIDAVKTELTKNKLVLTHSVKSSSQLADVVTLLVDFTLTDSETGESVTSTAIGAGQDKGDKHVYKALTGAYKYFLMKTLLIPTGDDPEASDENGKSTRGAAPSKASAEESPKKMVSFSKKALAKAAPTMEDDI